MIAEAVATGKTAKYADVTQRHLFCPVAVETYEPICVEGHVFIKEIGSRISAITFDPREAYFYISVYPWLCKDLMLYGIAGTFLRDQSDLPSLTRVEFLSLSSISKPLGIKYQGR